MGLSRRLSRVKEGPVLLATGLILHGGVFREGVPLSVMCGTEARFAAGVVVTRVD